MRLVFLLLGLSGCAFMGQQQYQDRVWDYDDDGVRAIRFGGRDCDDTDPGIGDCDADRDDHRTPAGGGDDCDDDDPEVHPGAAEGCNRVDDDCDTLIDDLDPDLVGAPTWFADDDGDRFGDPDATVAACVRPSDNWVADPGDCDDQRADVHPGATEFCDTLDRNCDGDAELGAVDPADWAADADHDGYAPFGVSALDVVKACSAPADHAAVPLTPEQGDCADDDDRIHPGVAEVFYDGIDADCAGDDDFDADGDGHPRDADCDDTTATISPTAPERCDGIDNDCDLLVDDDDPGRTDPLQIRWYVDADHDGFGDGARFTVFCPNVTPVAYVLLGTDCDDAFATVHPGATEICDDLDNDCNGAVDDGPLNPLTFYVDADGDGHGSAAAPVLACDADPGSGLSTRADDCNDADAVTHPGAVELCGDEHRQDCTNRSPYDCDDDGYLDEAHAGQDCDDTRAAIHPLAREVCDGIDNDCDDRLDDDDPNVDLSTIADWYRDLDGDGFGDPDHLLLPQACAPQPGLAANSLDCDDADANTWPDAPERCDGADNDCDGFADDEDPDDEALQPPEFFYDGDADGFGHASIRWVQTCAPPGGDWVLLGTDCRPDDGAIHPLATEVCNGVDDDCDTLVDTADPNAVRSVWYRDGDGDGWGQTSSALTQCGQPEGYAPAGGDCNDFQVAANPGASERCDGGIDNDCDGFADDADPDLADDVHWYRDADGDGYGTPGDQLTRCGQPAGYVANQADCDDGRAATSPAALEVCNNRDDDCDLDVDDADPDLVNAPLWFRDTDLDGWGSDVDPVHACAPPPMYRSVSGDCDDGRSEAHPGATETCNPGDEDCDGLDNEQDPSLVAFVWHLDHDRDGHGDPGITATGCTAPTPEHVQDATDCDDGRAEVHPGGQEVCGGGDDDCDGLIDDADPSVDPQGRFVYADFDRDGWGDDTTTRPACGPTPGWAATSGDCDDDNPQRSPSLTEICDAGIDNDCDGQADGDDPNGALGAIPWYPDVDGDLWGTGSPRLFCTDPGVGYASNPGDCVDGDPDVNPGEAEVCNGRDDDCDGLTDSADLGNGELVIGGFDADGDGYGGPALRLICPGEPGYATATGDCDDGDRHVHPTAPERCNGADDDCDFGVDDDDLEGVVDGDPYYDDGDGDGFGGAPPTRFGCAPRLGTVAVSGDCDDGDPELYPGQQVLVAPLVGKYDLLADAMQQACAPFEVVLVSGRRYPAPPGVFFSGPDSVLRASVEGQPAVVETGAIGVDLSHPRLEIRDVSFDFSQSGSAIYAASTDLVLERVSVTDHQDPFASGMAIGLQVDSGAQVTCVDCTFERLGGAGVGGPALQVDAGGELWMVGGRVAHNDHALLSTGTVVLEGTAFDTNGTAATAAVSTGGGDLVIVDVTSRADRAWTLANTAVHIDGMTLNGTGSLNFQGASAEVQVRGVTAINGRAAGMSFSGVVSASVSESALIGTQGTTSFGISVVNSPLVGFQNVTVAGFPFPCMLMANSTVSIRNGLFADCSLAFSQSGGSYTVQNAWVPPGDTSASSATSAEQVYAGDPLFRTWHPDLAPERWDVHVRPSGFPSPETIGHPSLIGPSGRFEVGAYGGPGEGYRYYLDVDLDALDDGWERLHFGDLDEDGTGDFDADGLPNLLEFSQGGWPELPDTDGDGVLDNVDSAGLLDPLH